MNGLQRTNLLFNLGPLSGAVKFLLQPLPKNCNLSAFSMLELLDSHKENYTLVKMIFSVRCHEEPFCDIFYISQCEPNAILYIYVYTETLPTRMSFSA